MASHRLTELTHDLGRALLRRDGADLTDAQLLTRFAERRDEAAFEALVRRHAPMVLGVCRRLLRNAQDAEDAFQVVFLVLVQKAASVRPREAVAGWLYGVARKAALKARAAGHRMAQDAADYAVSVTPAHQGRRQAEDRRLSPPRRLIAEALRAAAQGVAGPSASRSIPPS
jgi:RNA polymerase sigma factor (sigma-70 family)